MFDPITWTPSKFLPLTITISASSRSSTSAPDGKGTEIYWNGEPSRCLRNLDVGVDAHAANTAIRASLVQQPSAGRTIPEGLVDALRSVGVVVDVHDADEAPTPFADADGKINVTAFDRAVNAFVLETGVYPTTLLVSSDMAGFVAGAGLAVVELPTAPIGFIYVERNGYRRDGEPVRLVVDDTGINLEASAPHPVAPWRLIRRTPNDVGLPVGAHAARFVDDNLVVGGDLAAGDAGTVVPGFSS